MSTLDDLRDDATSLPSVEAKPHVGRPAFRVQDKLLMSADLRHQSAIVHVGAAATTTAAANDPATSEPPSSRTDAPGVDDGCA